MSKASSNMTDDLIAFATEMDRCWIERRLGDLSGYLSRDVVMVAPGGKRRTVGLDAAVESYREFLSRSEVSRFHTYDHVATQRGETAVVEYEWDIAWNDQGENHEARGREVLVLARYGQEWRVAWRMQIPV